MNEVSIKKQIEDSKRIMKACQQRIEDSNKRIKKYEERIEKRQKRLDRLQKKLEKNSKVKDASEDKKAVDLTSAKDEDNSSNTPEVNLEDTDEKEEDLLNLDE